MFARRFSLLLCLAAVALLGAQNEILTPAQAEAKAALDGTVTRHKDWEVRFGIGGGAKTDLAKLIDKPESFAVDLFRSKDETSGDSRILGVGEAHGVFQVTVEAAMAVVLDYPNIKAISPRVREVKVLESGKGRYHVYEDIGINFMGISIGYKLEAETFGETLGPGIAGVRCRMLKSIDGKLYAADSSWYFREVEIGGVAYTYIRTWSTSGLRNPGPGVAGIMKLFTAGELKDQLNSVAKLAAKR